MDYADLKVYRAADRWVAVSLTVLLTATLFLLLMTADNVGSLQSLERQLVQIQQQQQNITNDLPTVDNPLIQEADAGCANATESFAERLAGNPLPQTFSPGIYLVTRGGGFDTDIVRMARYDPISGKRVSPYYGFSPFDFQIANRGPMWTYGPGARQVSLLYSLPGQNRRTMQLLNLDTLTSTYHEITGCGSGTFRGLACHDTQPVCYTYRDSGGYYMQTINTVSWTCVESATPTSTVRQPVGGLFMIGDRLFAKGRYSYYEVNIPTGEVFSRDAYHAFVDRHDGAPVTSPFFSYNDEPETSPTLRPGQRVQYDKARKVVYTLYNAEGVQRLAMVNMSSVTDMPLRAGTINDRALQIELEHMTTLLSDLNPADYSVSMLYIPE